MVLIIYSIMTGILGLYLGSIFGEPILSYFFGFIGVLSPGLFVLERIYKDMEKKKTDNKS